MSHLYYSFWNIKEPVFTVSSSDRYIPLSKKLDSQIKRSVMNVKVPGSITSLNGRQGMGSTFTAEYILSQLELDHYESLTCLVSAQQPLESILGRLQRHFKSELNRPHDLESSLLLWSTILDELEIENRFLVIRLLWPRNPCSTLEISGLLDQLCDIQSYSSPRVSVLIENGPKHLVSESTKRRMSYSWYSISLSPIDLPAFEAFIHSRLEQADLPQDLFDSSRIEQVYELSSGAIKPATQLLESCLMMMAAHESKVLNSEIFAETSEQQPRKTRFLIRKKIEPKWNQNDTIETGNKSLLYQISTITQAEEVLTQSEKLNRAKDRAAKPKNNLLKKRLSPASIRLDDILDLDE